MTSFIYIDIDYIDLENIKVTQALSQGDQPTDDVSLAPGSTWQYPVISDVREIFC